MDYSALRMVLFTLIFVQLSSLPWSKDLKVESVTIFPDVGTDPGPQKGYSTDKQQVSPFRCYDMSVTNNTNVRSLLKLDQSMSYSEM